MTLIPIQTHAEGVAQLLLNIQTHKANGPDNLPARFLSKAFDRVPHARLYHKLSHYEIQGTLLL